MLSIFINGNSQQFLNCIFNRLCLHTFKYRFQLITQNCLKVVVVVVVVVVGGGGGGGGGVGIVG